MTTEVNLPNTTDSLPKDFLEQEKLQQYIRLVNSDSKLAQTGLERLKGVELSLTMLRIQNTLDMVQQPYPEV